MPNLLKMIILLIIIIGGFFFVMRLSKEVVRKRALKNALQMSDDIKRLLKQPMGYAEVAMKDRLKHAIRSGMIGLVVYVFILCIGFFKGFIQDATFDIKTYFLASLVILAFIVLLVLKDILKVAPWSEVYRVKAISCLSVHGSNHAEYVCYYDFVKAEFVAEALPDTTLLSKVRKSPEGIFDVLVIAGNRRLKLIDVVK